MSMIDFDIALLQNKSKISHNAHSTSLFSLATVKCICPSSSALFTVVETGCAKYRKKHLHAKVSNAEAEVT